ncbi:MAG: hypothetical protein KME38_08525 [Spirirestis rafaelensis WJT71-NPBG6]|jgi:hypothetical protein|nr:hypothetical protein [Spirirestis rafaelensis WJT71-NPBG6]
MEIELGVLKYGVHNGVITDPFYRDANERQKLTKTTSGKSRHLGIDVSVCDPHRGGADDRRRGLPVYATPKPEIDLNELNNVRVFTDEGNQNGLGIVGQGSATLNHAVVLVQPWQSGKNGISWGGVIGLAYRYDYTQLDASPGRFTLYTEYVHLITLEFLPRDGKILGELMEIRRGCQSWLGVGECHYHNCTGKAQSLIGAPEWIVPVYHPRRGTINCFRDYLDLSSLYEAAWTYIDGKLEVTVYSTIDLCKGDLVEPSLLESYLPRLQGYGEPVEIFPFTHELIRKGKVLFETKLDYGTRLASISADEVSDAIPRGWYDQDFKVVMRYSKELVPM